MQITSITQDAIQSIILSQLTPQLVALYSGSQIGAPSTGELEKIAKSVATSAAKGTFDKIVAPVKEDIKSVIDTINPVIDAISALKSFSGLGFSIPPKLSM